MSREAMQLALEALEKVITAFGSGLTLQQNAITALRQALETEQKTVVSPGKGTGFNYARASQKTAVSPDGGTGFIDGVWYGPPQRKPLTDEQIIKHFQEHVDTGSLLSFADGVRFAEAAHGRTPLYTAAPKKEWVGLTDEEIQDLGYLSQKIDEGNSPWFDRLGFAKAIEQALKEKNA